VSTRTEYVPGKPSSSQAHLLAEAVLIAYKAGWKGSMRENARPSLPGWATLPTISSLRSKGLVEPAEDGKRRGGYKKLTIHGVAAGEATYKATYGISAEDQAEKNAKERQKVEQDAQDRKDRVKHLFRGLHVDRQASYSAKGKKGRSIAAHIDRSSSIQMNIDDLLVLGEEIEKLR
jgi:hypothetical protein